MRKKTYGGSNASNEKNGLIEVNSGSFINSFLTPILLFVIAGLLIYIAFFPKKESVGTSPTTIVEIGGSGKPDRFNDIYSPPLKNDGMFFPLDGNISGISTTANQPSPRAINIQTRGYSPEFTQIGILTSETKMNQHEPKILPLMGRRILNGRDKYQYYTISNSGVVNTKLPIIKDGRNCMNENGCDEIYGGTFVTVEGYGEKFKATIYENEMFRYIP
jgi:hypothetical protein